MKPTRKGKTTVYSRRIEPVMLIGFDKGVTSDMFSIESYVMGTEFIKSPVSDLNYFDSICLLSVTKNVKDGNKRYQCTARSHRSNLNTVINLVER